MNMNDVEKQFYDFIISMIVNQNIIEEVEIDAKVSELRILPMFSALSDEQIGKIKAIITSERSIHLQAGSLIEEKKHEKWFISKKAELEMTYWNRYKKYLLQDKKFQPSVVNSMDDILDTLTDLLGNPENESYSRKGLILGDVQSGKTANYTGLICKAADSKYKVIVLLTGTIEKLRVQTQMRLDEGFVGLDSAAMVKQLDSPLIGSGKFDPSVHPVVLTSTLDDFKSQTARNLGFNLKNMNDPVLFVVKKNVSVLKRLNKWLRTFNQNGENKIDTSILVIDDEADNASVNTNPEDKDPTAINNQITELIDVFTRSSYVGFTATPYANIFIDPNSADQMKKEDLFPKDYIYALNAPSNYIGARDIFSEKGKYRNMCIEFTEEEEEELEDLLPLNHKSGFNIPKLPKSMQEAVCVFLVGNAIRDLRGDTKSHRSMLVNVSRFNNVQKQIFDKINSLLKDIQSAVRVNAGLEAEQAGKNEYIRYMEKIFYKHYLNLEFTWEEIFAQLHKAIAPVMMTIVNQNSGKGLDYEEYSAGLRVIAVGGLSLSRGLTLEGLMISYFYRNSKMYDTLMQMGRWFGFRKNYDDICRLWMTSTSIEWYSHISEATDELRHDIERYEDSGLTPLDFGLRVRTDINTLLVTARNKMRTADTAVCTISLSEECIETPDLFVSDLKNNININAVDRLIDAIKIDTQMNIITSGNSKMIRNVDRSIIVDLLDDIEIPLTNETFDTEVLIDFIEQYRGTELEKWDVVFANGSYKGEEYFLWNENSVQYKKMTFSLINNDTIVRMSGSKRRLGSIGDGLHGLQGVSSKELQERVCADANISRESLRQNDYFKERYIMQDRNPQLIIYNIFLDGPATHANKTEDLNNISQCIGKKIVGFGIGIPKLKDRNTEYATYTLNKVAQILRQEYDIGDEE